MSIFDDKVTRKILVLESNPTSINPIIDRITKDANEYVRDIAKKERDYINTGLVQVETYSHPSACGGMYHKVQVGDLYFSIGRNRRHYESGYMTISVYEKDTKYDSEARIFMYGTPRKIAQYGTRHQLFDISQGRTIWKWNTPTSPEDEIYNMPEDIQIALWIICDFELIDDDSTLCRIEDILRKQRGSKEEE